MIPYHNPKNIETAGEGWRFKVEGELVLEVDDFWSSMVKMWFKVASGIGQSPHPELTIRTREPLPEPWIYSDPEYQRGVEERGMKQGWVICKPHNSDIWTPPYKITPLTYYFDWRDFHYKIADEPKEEVKGAHNEAYPTSGKCDHFHGACDECAPKPKVILDWSKLPKEAICATVDNFGHCYCWNNFPVRCEGTFHHSSERGISWPITIPFTFSGDWKDSLTPRPEVVNEDQWAFAGSDDIKARIASEQAATSAGDSPDASTASGEVRAQRYDLGVWSMIRSNYGEFVMFIDHQRLQSERDRLRVALWNMLHGKNNYVMADLRWKYVYDAEQLLEEIKP